MSEKSRHKNHEKGNHATCWLGRVPVATASLGGLRSGSQRWAIRHWRHTLATTAATRPKMRYVSRIATISPAKAEGRVAASAVAKRRHCMFGLAAQEQRTDNVFWALPLCPTPHGWTNRCWTSSHGAHTGPQPHQGHAVEFEAVLGRLLRTLEPAGAALRRARRRRGAYHHPCPKKFGPGCIGVLGGTPEIMRCLGGHC